jgi:Protein of unknown function (DUF3800)
LPKFSHVVYIDEAGDEGFGKLKTGSAGGQSHWLLLGAAITRNAADKQLPAWRDQMLQRFPEKKQRDLHFRYLNHAQKVVVCQEIAKRPIAGCVTFSNKATIPDTRRAELFKRPGQLYNYLVRWLLERVTVYCAQDARDLQIECRVKVVFSRRGGTDYDAMSEYMRLMRDGKERFPPTRSIDWQAFSPDDIAVEAHGKWAGLQIADAITSAFFHAVEPNGYGNLEPRYADCLRDTMIRDAGASVLGFGVAPVPSLDKCKPTAEQRAFFSSFTSKK